MFEMVLKCLVHPNTLCIMHCINLTLQWSNCVRILFLIFPGCRNNNAFPNGHVLYNLSEWCPYFFLALLFTVHRNNEAFVIVDISYSI